VGFFDGDKLAGAWS